MKTNIAVADSQFLIGHALERLIEENDQYNLVGHFTNFISLSDSLKSNQVDLLITDFATFDYESMDQIKDILEKYSSISVLILTNQICKGELGEMTKIGIRNIVYKNVDRDDFFKAIDATLKKKKFYSGEVLDILLEENPEKIVPQSPCQLTNAELEIVRLIATGLTTKKIALQKHVSFHTVMSHRKNIFRKLGINNAQELLMYSVRAGLIDTTEIIEYNI